MPLTRTSRCRCGPVEFPVFPIVATWSPGIQVCSAQRGLGGRTHRAGGHRCDQNTAALSARDSIAVVPSPRWPHRSAGVPRGRLRSVHFGGEPQDGPDQLQRCLISVQVEIVAQLAGVYDLEVFVERAVLGKHEFSQSAELVERNDLGDLIVPVGRVARRRGPTLLRQSEDLRAVTKSLSGSGDLTKLTGR